MRVGARIIAAEVTEPGQARGMRRRRRTWAVALTAGLLIALAFTPPGRAVTAQLGELVGIGEEPTVDRDNPEASVVATGRQVVIATGTTPSGERYEMSAFAGGRSAAEQQKLKERFPDAFREYKAEHPDDPILG